VNTRGDNRRSLHYAPSEPGRDDNSIGQVKFFPLKLLRA
jgi:hypothetical protein